MRTFSLGWRLRLDAPSGRRRTWASCSRTRLGYRRRRRFMAAASGQSRRTRCGPPRARRSRWADGSVRWPTTVERRPVTRRELEHWRRQRECWDRVVDLLPVPGSESKSPTRTPTFRALLSGARLGARRAPALVILSNRSDGATSQMWVQVGAAASECCLPLLAGQDAPVVSVAAAKEPSVDLPRFRRRLNASGRKPGNVRFRCPERGRRIPRSSVARRSVARRSVSPSWAIGRSVSHRRTWGLSDVMFRNWLKEERAERGERPGGVR